MALRWLPFSRINDPWQTRCRLGYLYVCQDRSRDHHRRICRHEIAVHASTSSDVLCWGVAGDVHGFPTTSLHAESIMPCRLVHWCLVVCLSSSMAWDLRRQILRRKIAVHTSSSSEVLFLGIAGTLVAAPIDKLQAKIFPSSIIYN